ISSTKRKSSRTTCEAWTRDERHSSGRWRRRRETRGLACASSSSLRRETDRLLPRGSNPAPPEKTSRSSSGARARSAKTRSKRPASKKRSSKTWGDRLKSRIREALYIGLFDALPLLRDPMLLVVISLFSFLPVIFIFVFADQKSAMQSLVGAIVLTFSFTGLFASQSVYFNKQWFRFQDMLVASKVSPASYAVGLSVSGLVVALPGVVVALVLLLLSGPMPAAGVFLLLATSLLLLIGLGFVGFAIGAATKNAPGVDSIPQVLSIALGFLPPVYYPLDRLPAIAQPIAILLPTTHAAQLAKYYLHLISIPSSEVAIGWAYLLGFAALMGFIASRRAHWVDP